MLSCKWDCAFPCVHCFVRAPEGVVHAICKEVCAVWAEPQPCDAVAVPRKAHANLFPPQVPCPHHVVYAAREHLSQGQDVCMNEREAQHAALQNNRSQGKG